MRRRSGTTDLRALLYMDEVAGYLPPTAAPPTKKPIMTLIKQARAFGVGVVLSTQNPVDIDYKALSNAGTWMIGRLQTEQDKQRLLDGMSAASGGVDIGALGATIGGLAKREFVLRRAGRDQPEAFTTRWAMSYLRGPLTRDQIAMIMSDQKAQTAGASPSSPDPSVTASVTPPAPGSVAGKDETTVMPDIASGIPVRWADIAAPWLTTVGGHTRGSRLESAIVARVALRSDDDKAALKDKKFWTRIERDLLDFLVRSRTVELQTNRELKLFSRPGETAEAFALRCTQSADAQADVDNAALRTKSRWNAFRPSCRPPKIAPTCSAPSSAGDKAKNCCRPPARFSEVSSVAASAGADWSAASSARPAPRLDGVHARPLRADERPPLRTKSSCCIRSSKNSTPSSVRKLWISIRAGRRRLKT